MSMMFYGECQRVTQRERIIIIPWLLDNVAHRRFSIVFQRGVLPSRRLKYIAYPLYVRPTGVTSFPPACDVVHEQQTRVLSTPL